MTRYVHPQAICESDQIGAHTRIWAFAHVLPGAAIGEDCNIYAHVFVENDVRVGDRVTIKCGVQLWDGITLEDDVFVGPNATFTNDRCPHSKEHREEIPRTHVAEGASLGANSTILPGLKIGKRAMVGAGAVVTRDVPPNAIVVGNPAQIVGYAGTTKRSPAVVAEPGAADRGVPAPTEEIVLATASLRRLTVADDLRGSLSAAQFPEELPFVPKRVFIVHGVPGRDVRGEHAHRECHQFLICVSGSVSVVLDTGSRQAEVELSSPEVGLYLPPMIWSVQYKYSPDAVLVVLASKNYDPDDYIRDYDEFLDAVRKH